MVVGTLMTVFFYQTQNEEMPFPNIVLRRIIKDLILLDSAISLSSINGLLHV